MPAPQNRCELLEKLDELASILTSKILSLTLNAQSCSTRIRTDKEVLCYYVKK